MPLYDFKCDECDAFYRDQLVKMGTIEINCDCGGIAKKEMSYRFASIGLPNGHIAIKSNLNNQEKK